MKNLRKFAEVNKNITKENMGILRVVRETDDRFEPTCYMRPRVSIHERFLHQKVSHF